VPEVDESPDPSVPVLERMDLLKGDVPLEDLDGVGGLPAEQSLDESRWLSWADDSSGCVGVSTALWTVLLNPIYRLFV